MADQSFWSLVRDQRYPQHGLNRGSRLPARTLETLLIIMLARGLRRPKENCQQIAELQDKEQYRARLL